MSIKLISPCAAYLPSYAEACRESSGTGPFAYRFTDPDRFDVLGKFERLAASAEAHSVKTTYLWLVDDERIRFIGEISIRHSLTPPLRRIGGHVGYGVRPSEQGRGYGTLMLRLALPHARQCGLTRMLITCDERNIASARVMEKNGFTMENRVKCGGILIRRYWKNLYEGDEIMRNIVLIGMPGCGKSTVGVVLAKALAMDFVDSDLVIQKEMNAKLSELLDKYGDDGFRDIEENVNAHLAVQNSVIATGGSVIYGPKAMEHLKEIGTVVYLQLSYEAIEDRLGDLHARGVTIKPGWTLRDLYNERCPMYEQWADVTIRCDGVRLRNVVVAVQEAVKRHPKKQ